MNPIPTRKLELFKVEKNPKFINKTLNFLFSFRFFLFALGNEAKLHANEIMLYLLRRL